jgi:exodeoxyribonuclease V alpha subunit
MNRLPELNRFVRTQFPHAQAELLDLYDAAIDDGILLFAEICTIHDLLHMSGHEKDEPLHALLILMLAALEEGSVCIEASEPALTTRLSHFLEIDPAKTWARRLIADLKNPGYANVVGSDLAGNRPILFCRHADSDFLYFHKHYKHESEFAAALRNRLTNDQACPLNMNLAPVIQEILINQAPLFNGNAVQLNNHQQLGLALALLKNFAVLTGGPGTGKTSIVFALLRCLLRCGYNAEQIVMAAPTGLAAQRLTDAIRKGFEALPAYVRENGPDTVIKDISALTLHRLLQYQPSRGTFRHHADNPLPYDVVIVDEISMVGLVLMAQLFQAIKPEAKLILLGDKDQLPSVEVGAFPGHLIPADGRPCYTKEMQVRLANILPHFKVFRQGRDHVLRDALVMLEENYRSQAQIQEVARSINAQDETLLDRLPCCSLTGPLPEKNTSVPPGSVSFENLCRQGGCWLLEAPTANLNDWQRVLRLWADHHYGDHSGEKASYFDKVKKCQPIGSTLEPYQEELLTEAFAGFAQARILTLIRSGPWGSEGINNYLNQYLRSKLSRPGKGGMFPGVPVLVTRNDYDRELFNGDVGISLQSALGGYCVVFQRSGRFLIIPQEALPAHELAFAVTVHKSQGSEYNKVLIVLPPDGGRRLLTKEILYTGVTRAKDLVLLYGSKENLRIALLRKVERTSGLAYLSI